MSHQMHQTHLTKTYPTGVEHWVCSTCRREIIFQFAPLNPKNIVLVEGDQTVAHSGSKGMSLLEIDISQDEDEPVFDPDLRDQINDALEDL